MSAIDHVIYRLRNTPVLNYPYPHFYCKEVFPEAFYDQLIGCLPNDKGYEPLSGGYPSRVAAKDPNPLVSDFNDPYFASHVLGMFSRQYQERFPCHDNPRFRTDVRFIRDSEGYKIGPHTDAPNKVVSILFYLPKDFSDYEFGTGIYVPDDHVQTCAGGPHYKFSGFTEVWRAPFLPNSCFGFWKTPNSWHAVARISRKIQRDVMLYNIYHVDTENGDQQGSIQA
jgi:hypothetical protein